MYFVFAWHTNLLYNIQRTYFYASVALLAYTSPWGLAANVYRAVPEVQGGHPLLFQDAGQYRLGTSYLVTVPVMRQMKGGLSPLHYWDPAVRSELAHGRPCWLRLLVYRHPVS